MNLNEICFFWGGGGGGEGGLILAIFVPTFYVGNPIAT